ncbi:hypothetical protein I204_06630 [Kwoniella mangroviensis CBS 8886]|uniref:uncharacterized protein n=1 Tax=Kwoniella mangroviensis CBS 8507 TaxID=1296122 RepID=UPI00080D76EC|nr:uncharacterized protein I203_01398 [Kwoniella mangroviensis CBS 8507]OCF69537.1 hypothetical protein I203_01398 [Kwoniella mangroviensis CBS 8507]OCF72255.1 hypothetical protein I204_06630 [Kwoniella mangroviensis CBS 8886]
MESSGSPILTPLSPSSLHSPPPLSSAGLSSRITSSVSTVHPRLSTLLPNSSGYLAFSSRPKQEIIQKNKKRSYSFSSYFRRLPRRLNRSFSSTVSRGGPKDRLNSPARPQEYVRKEKEKDPVTREEEWKEVEDEWKSQAKGLKEGYMQCLNGARCITITDPIGDLTDEFLQSTVIISSSQDPFPHVSDMTHQSSRRRSSSTPELSRPILPTLPGKFNLSPVPPSPASYTPLKSSKEDHDGVHRDETHEEEVIEDNARILDVRAGTASSSTRRVPTQKSVHPTLGNKSTENGEMVNHHSIPDMDDSEEEDLKTPRQVDEDVFEPLIFPVPRIQQQLPDHGNATFSADDESVSLPKADSLTTHSSHWNTVNPHRPARPSAPAPPLTTPSERGSLVLAPDEYEYLLPLQVIDVINTPISESHISSSHSRYSAGIKRSHSTSTSSSSSTARPIVRPNNTLNNDTPLYSLEGNSHSLSVQSPSTTSTYQPNFQGGTRDVYREHLQRAVVQQYNDSLTPRKPPNQGQGDMLVVPDRRGQGKGLRRALGRGIWYKRSRNGI